MSSVGQPGSGESDKCSVAPGSGALPTLLPTLLPAVSGVKTPHGAPQSTVKHQDDMSRCVRLCYHVLYNITTIRSSQYYLDMSEIF